MLTKTPILRSNKAKTGQVIAGTACNDQIYNSEPGHPKQNRYEGKSKLEEKCK